MTVSKALIRSAVGAALILAVIGGSPLFAGETIHNGVDLWMTVAGFAQTSFASEPVPAGFFCESSQPFTGIVKFKARKKESLRKIEATQTNLSRLKDIIQEIEKIGR